MRKFRRIGLVIAVCLLIVSPGGGCVNVSSEQPRPLTELHVSYAVRPINVPSILAVNKKFFEESFAKQGISIVWHELAGTETTEALAAGAINIATSLNTLSALITKAAGNDIKIISGYSQFPEAIGLVATQSSGIETIKDFQGKKIAVTQGTMLQEMMIKVLAEGDLTVNDVEIVNIDSPDGLVALLSGHIDAAVLPEPLLTKALASGKVNLIKTAEGIINGQTVIAARTDFLDNYPDLAKRFLEVHEECLLYMVTHEEEILQMSAAAVDMPLAAVQKLYPKFNFSSQLQNQDIQGMKESVEFLRTYGFIKTDISADLLLDELLDLSYSP